MRYTYRYRSFFWPALLILAGVVALLVNTGQIPVERLARIIDLWPLILVVIGLELIVRRTVHGVAGDVAAALLVLLARGGAVGHQPAKQLSFLPEPQVRASPRPESHRRVAARPQHRVGEHVDQRRPPPRHLANAEHRREQGRDHPRAALRPRACPDQWRGADRESAHPVRSPGF